LLDRSDESEDLKFDGVDTRRISSRPIAVSTDAIQRAGGTGCDLRALDVAGDASALTVRRLPPVPIFRSTGTRTRIA